MFVGSQLLRCTKEDPLASLPLSPWNSHAFHVAFPLCFPSSSGYCNPGNDTTNVVDDPHFTGARGTKFDFNGELDKAFCLVTDKRIHINAVLKGYKSTNTYRASVGADGKATRSWIRYTQRCRFVMNSTALYTTALYCTVHYSPVAVSWGYKSTNSHGATVGVNGKATRSWIRHTLPCSTVLY